MYLILNAAMVPNEGTFQYQLIDQQAARAWLLGHPDAVSYIGYPQTAEWLEHLAGRPIALNREKVTMAIGDEALVCRLSYRVRDPSTKGQYQEEDWEYGLLRRIA
jgi:hypothetical protein